jgi:hypothetical protein
MPANMATTCKRNAPDTTSIDPVSKWYKRHTGGSRIQGRSK